ncbi:hypothetical protein QYF36_012042 [Acer negundo]|nr:hypothetical protein QYF36_012042 [Acer negundo]
MESVMLVKYERLPDFNFRCWILGYIIKDCYDKPKDLEAANGEEFLFGFWMRASAPSRRSRNGGRKWLLDERGEGLPFKERGNWRSLNRAEAGRDGDRREFPMANGDGSLQQNPRLESGSKGKEIVVTNDYGSNAEFERLSEISTPSNFQESEDMENLDGGKPIGTSGLGGKAGCDRKSSVSDQQMNQVLNKVHPRLSSHSFSLLDRPFTTEEMRIAIFSIASNKAPGPDGFTGIVLLQILGCERSKSHC